MTEPNWPKNEELLDSYEYGWNSAIDACKKAYDEAKGQELVALDEKELHKIYYQHFVLMDSKSAIFLKAICSTFATPKPRAGVSVEDIAQKLYEEDIKDVKSNFKSWEFAKNNGIGQYWRELAQAVHKLLSEGK